MKAEDAKPGMYVRGISGILYKLISRIEPRSDYDRWDALIVEPVAIFGPAFGKGKISSVSTNKITQEDPFADWVRQVREELQNNG